MTISIADLKKKQSFLDKIKTKIDQTSSGGNRDPRFWAPTFDKETGGGAVIRFLPSADLNEVPFVEKDPQNHRTEYREISLYTDC